MIKSGNKEPSKSTSWKVLETVMSHLKTKFGNFTKDQQGYMPTENLFKPSNRKDCRGVVLANVFKSVGISLDRSETYSYRFFLWQKNPQFGQSICFDTRRKQET